MEKVRGVLFIVVSLFSFVAISDGNKLNIEDLKKLVGKENSYVLDLYEDNPSNNTYLLDMLEQEKKRNKISREKISKYSKLRRNYLAYGMKLKFEQNKKKGPSRSIASVDVVETKEKLIYKVPQYLGLTFFKRNDLSGMCHRIVQQAKSLSAEGIAFFYPVHFSGGNSKGFSMPANPKYGKDYAYETAQSPDNKVLFDCLDKILESGLKINYVPHLESISSLTSSGTQEWRMYSGIPLDDYYYYYSFSPLFNYLKSSKKRKKLAQKLLVTFGAEIDNMVLGHPKSANKIVKDLREELLTVTTKKIPILLNTNGDFYHMWKIPQAKKSELNCSELDTLISSLDYVSPSMYGDKGHFKRKDNRLSINQTLEEYYTQFKNMLPKRCYYLEKKLRKISIGFGEFALDPTRKQNYVDILKSPGRVKFVQYWNHSKWDHLAVYPKNKALNLKIRQQLISD